MKRAQELGITFVEYTICVLLDLWGAFLQEKYPRVRLSLECLIFYAYRLISKVSSIYHMPHHVKKYTNAIRPMVRCIWIK
jgi:hypothetical protein